jgi:hypothetical protein
MWSGPSDAGTPERPLGIHEGAEEILACSHHHSSVDIGGASGFDTRFGHRAVYLHNLLKRRALRGSLAMIPRDYEL